MSLYAYNNLKTEGKMLGRRNSEPGGQQLREDRVEWLQTQLELKKQRLAEIGEAKRKAVHKRRQERLANLRARMEQIKLAGFCGEQAKQHAQIKRETELRCQQIIKQLELIEQGNSVKEDKWGICKEDLEVELEIKKERLAEIREMKQKAVERRAAAEQERMECARVFEEEQRRQTQLKREAKAQIDAITKELELIKGNDTVEAPKQTAKEVVTVPQNQELSLHDVVAGLFSQVGIGPEIVEEKKSSIRGLKLKLRIKM